MKDILDISQEYQDKGFKIFPVHGVTPEGHCTCGNHECMNQGKHPATMRGLLNATKDYSTYLKLINNRDNLNIAIATGADSGIIVIDIDGVAGESSIAELERINGRLPETLVSETGKGRHILFKHPGKRVPSRVKKLGDGLDVRGDGGYIVAPPSRHILGHKYKWENESAAIADCPSWLVDLICGDVKPKVHAPLLSEHTEKKTYAGIRSEWTSEQVREMLSFLDPDMFRDDWIAVGMALHSGGYSLALWDEWSRRGAKYDGSTIASWRSFKPDGAVTMGTLVDMAQKMGWSPHPVDIKPINIETHPAREFLIRIGNISKDAPMSKTDGGTIRTVDYNSMPDLISDTVKWILESAIFPQPDLAMMNVITALGAVFGRRYMSPINTRTNLYVVCIADTSAGKDHSRKCIKSLMAAAGLAEFVGGDDIISGRGIITSMFKRPSQIMHLDEFGKLLQATFDERASHMKQVGMNLMNLYSTSGSTFIGGDYADVNAKPVTIIYPNLCIYGTTTLTTYLETLNDEAISSGQLNRFVVMPAKDNNPTPNCYPSQFSPPESLVERWAALKNTSNNLDVLNLPNVEPKQIVVSWESCKKRIMEDLLLFQTRRKEQLKNSKIKDLWGRYRENVIKIAMILAASKNHITPAITDSEIDIADAIVSSSIEYVSKLATENFFHNNYEKEKNGVRDYIKRTGGASGVSMTEITRANRKIKSRDLDEIIKSLMQEESINAVRNTLNNGRTIVKYVAC